MLEKLEAAEEAHGERFAPPTVLKRLVAQGRLGMKSGQGFYAYPQADDGDQTDTVKLETRGDVAIAWLANPPMNAISPQVIKDLGTVWEKVKASGEIGAMVIASSIPVVFSAGADIKAFTQMDEAGGEELIHSGHALLRDMGVSRVSTIAAVNSLAFGGGCELAMACDFRIAAESAVFGQPEIKLGIIPGFGGTQRLPRLVGNEKALEMNLIGDAISSGEAEAYGLANRVVPDHELFDTALAWARKLAGQAPIAVEQVKRAADEPDLDEGIEAGEEGLRDRVHDRGRQGGDQRVPRQADAEVERKVSRRSPVAAATPMTDRATSSEQLATRLASSSVAPIRSSPSPAPGSRVPSGIPDFRSPGAVCGRRSTRWRSRTSTPSIATRGASGASTAPGSPNSMESSRTALTRRSPSSSRGGCLDGDRHPEHRPPALQGGLGPGDRGPRLDRDLELHDLPDQLSARERR